jgi:hypothetical protein
VRDQIGDPLAEQLGSRVAEQPTRRLVDVGVAAIEVRDEDRIRGMVDQDAQLGERAA